MCHAAIRIRNSYYLRMNNSKIIKAANILYNSRINLKKIKELPKNCTPKSFQEAYAIQDELTKRYLSANEKTLINCKKHQNNQK